jgi:cell division protein FtsB
LNAQIENLEDEIKVIKNKNIDLNNNNTDLKNNNVRYMGIIEEINDDDKKVTKFEVTNDIEIFKLYYYIYLI